jgi:hypothetical protein
MARYGKARRGKAWYGEAWQGKVKGHFGKNQNDPFFVDCSVLWYYKDFARFGMARFGKARPGWVRLGLVRYGLVRFCFSKQEIHYVRRRVNFSI